MSTPSRDKALAEVTAGIEGEYRKRTKRSYAVSQEARKYLPGGDTRRSIFFFPYPVWIDHADGCHAWDEDGNDYLDFHNCYTTMILGHGNPGVKAAIKEQLDQGTVALGAFKKNVVTWAQILCERVESVDQVRFTCTGTEAVMMSLRAARAWTGRDKVIVEYGGYHGAYDAVVFPPDSRGLPKSLMADTIVVPYSDKEALGRALEENKGQVAALLLEGLMGAAGMIPAKEGYLEYARKVTREHDVLFILDEIISFRLDYGGIQRLENVKPDLTTFGKIMAGGTAMAAFGGRHDLMQLYSPDSQVLHHAGTLNANPLSAAAGVAMMQQITPEMIARINALGDSLRIGMQTIFHKAGVKGQVTGMGSLNNVHFGPVPVVDGHTSRNTTNKEILHLFHLSLLNRGILTPERSMFCISSPMSERDVKTVLEAVEDTVRELKPHVEQIWPELIGTV
ncbi:MAG: aspartate aminotransferase family protein [Dehalococcoidia bacterium]|nr:MAG: aspartate aminotransferase family protein [Dehalococcoidia bacterium]